MISFSAFAISRANMPQIDDIDGFIKFTSKFGIGYNKITLYDLSGINPTQTDFNQDKIDSIKSSWNLVTGNDKPVLISKEDGFVLDGHHRYLAAKQLQTPLNIVFFDLSINKLLAMANTFLDKN